MADQRALAEPEGALDEDCTPWMDGEAPGGAEQRSAESALDQETKNLLRNQRQYYDSVHAVREQVRPSQFCMPVPKLRRQALNRYQDSLIFEHVPQWAWVMQHPAAII